ncbi:protein lin-54 homolog [Hypomesus transpacificus]|uniref:protein lin-54 homolog n=1 Tax=Hypomesus transpacificus TaxID=137520 RepID=UPI001F0863B0|nr:protein lin-54 homolog [Hypomesus transpacificus]
MSCFKEQNHSTSRLESTGESSDCYSLHAGRAYEPSIDGPGDPSDLIDPVVLPHLVGGGDGGWPGQSRVGEHPCTNYIFYCSLPPHHDPEGSLPQRLTHPVFHSLGTQSGPYPLLNPMTGLASSAHPNCSRSGSWETEGAVLCDMTSGELYDAVASICPDSLGDHAREIVPQPDKMADVISQNHMDIGQSVVCSMNGGGQVVLLNNCSPGQMFHSLAPAAGHQPSPEPLYESPTSRRPLDHRLSLDMGVRVSSGQLGAAVVGQAPAPGAPSYLGLQPSPVGTHTPLPHGQISPAYGYGHLPGHNYSQYHQAVCHQALCPLYSDVQPLAPDSQRVAPDPPKLELAWDSKSKKPCNCTKSQCLKLYCDCFANGDVCSNCNCVNCFNNEDHESERYKAIKICLDRNPEAFRPKIGQGKSGEVKGRHNKGCNCKRSGCLKNYCECYEAKIMCSSTCKCVGCRNYEDSPARRTVVWDSPDTTFYKKANCQKNKCPLSCITLDVVEATCGCLLAQAEEAEKELYSLTQAERIILEEFGQCLTQIVRSIFKSTSL